MSPFSPLADDAALDTGTIATLARAADAHAAARHTFAERQMAAIIAAFVADSKRIADARALDFAVIAAEGEER